MTGHRRWLYFCCLGHDKIHDETAPPIHEKQLFKKHQSAESHISSAVRIALSHIETNWAAYLYDNQYAIATNMSWHLICYDNNQYVMTTNVAACLYND